MAEAGSILIVDDDDDILAAGRLLLQRHFGEVADRADSRSASRRSSREHASTSSCST